MMNTYIICNVTIDMTFTLNCDAQPWLPFVLSLMNHFHRIAIATICQRMAVTGINETVINLHCMLPLNCAKNFFDCHSECQQ